MSDFSLDALVNYGYACRHASGPDHQTDCGCEGGAGIGAKETCCPAQERPGAACGLIGKGCAMWIDEGLE